MLTTGIKGALERTVTEELTAKAMGSGELPVFATPAVVVLAEECAWTWSSRTWRLPRWA